MDSPSPSRSTKGKSLTDETERLLATNWVLSRKPSNTLATTQTIEYTGDDPLAFVLSKNLHRRHLTTSQRAMVAEKLANLSEGRPELTAQNCAVNQSEAAKQFNVSRRSVQEARKIRTKAVPEVAEAVEAGKLPVSVAAKLADVPPEQQREIVAKKDKKAIIAEVREKKQQKCKSGAAASRRKTIAKEPEPDFAERYRQWLDDPNEKETPVPEQNEEGILKLAMPLDHRAMSAVFMKTFRKESEEVRDRIIAEVTQLAYAIGNLND